jgi:hypothetical protein
MKKLFAILTLPIIVGAGCAASTTNPAAAPSPANTVSTSSNTTAEWALSFALPSDWIMTDGCVLNGVQVSCGNNIVDITDPGELPQLDREIDPNAQIVYLQNTTKLPLFGGIAPNESVASFYQQRDLAVISVTRVQTPGPVPPTYGMSTEDLGNGFYRVVTCEKDSDCQIYGRAYYDYYFVAPSGDQYKFGITSTGPTEEQIEQIVLSAHENAR